MFIAVIHLRLFINVQYIVKSAFKTILSPFSILLKLLANSFRATPLKLYAYWVLLHVVPGNGK